MKRFPLTLPAVGSTYPFDIDGTITLRTIESVDLGQGLMVLTSPDHPPRPTHINNVVEFVRPNDAAAWLPVLREHYTMDDEGRTALIAEANASPIDTELMEAVDAWHTAGENTDDLSHDLYATIGDPVPPLVWPRWESEQSPTRSDAPSLSVKDFTLDARVKIAMKADPDDGGAEWVDEMDETIGQLGAVIGHTDSGRVLVRVPDGCTWAYAPEALALENACGEVTKAPDAAPVFNIGDLVTVREIEADNGFRSEGVNGELGAVTRHPLVDQRFYVYISKEKGGWFSPEALERTTVHATMNELNTALVEQGKRHGAAWATEPTPVAGDEPAKPRAY